MAHPPLAAALAASLVLAQPAAAHFLELLPSADVLPEGGAVSLDLRFTHPFEGGPMMRLERPVQAGMATAEGTTDLTDRLEPAPVEGVEAWRMTLDLDRPGAAVVFAVPQPYWEPAEGKYIRHYPKVVIDSYASGEGWDVMAGLPVEIRPLTRATGLWAGNSFSGVVLQDGAPVPFAEIEVEPVTEGRLPAPNDAFITQVIRADANGTFTYAMPFAGWWGFAALLEGEPMPGPEGSPVPVEEGALIWVHATALPDMAQAAR